MTSFQSTDLALRFVPVCPSIRSQRGNYAKPADWLQHKDRITQLYLIENKTLRRVQEIMELEHGLVATPKMWKRKIGVWNLDRKNMKQEDGAEILRQIAHLAATGNPLPQKFVVGGREFDMKRVQQYLLQSRQINVRRLYCSRRLACVAENSPGQGLSLQTLDTVELFLHTLTKWSKSSLEGGLWRVSESKIQFEGEDRSIRDSIRDFNLSANLSRRVKRLEWKTAFDSLESNICNSIPQVVKSGDYKTVRALLDEIGDLGENEHCAFATRILRLCAEEARRVFPSCHARVTFFNILARIDFHHVALAELVCRTDECVVDVVKSHSGSDHLAVVGLAWDFGLRLCEDFPFSKARQTVMTTMRKIEMNGHTWREAFSFVGFVTQALIPQGKLEEAAVVSRWMLDRAEEKSGWYANYLTYLSELLASRVAEAQNDAEAMASSLLRLFQSVRQWQGIAQITRMNQLATIIEELESLGESYSELAGDASSSFTNELHRFEVASERAGKSLEQYLFERDLIREIESDSGWDSEEDSGMDYEVGSDSHSVADTEKGSSASDGFDAELPKDWPAVDDVMNCETAFEWAMAPVETRETVPQSFEIDDLLEIDKIWEV